MNYFRHSSSDIFNFYCRLFLMHTRSPEENIKKVIENLVLLSYDNIS